MADILHQLEAKEPAVSKPSSLDRGLYAVLAAFGLALSVVVLAGAACIVKVAWMFLTHGR